MFAAARAASPMRSAGVVIFRLRADLFHIGVKRWESSQSMTRYAAVLFAVPAAPVVQTQPEVKAVKFGWRKLRGTSSASGKNAQDMRIGLIPFSDSSPPIVVNAEAAAKDGNVWKELVIVEKIEFSDGSKWDKTGS